MLKTLKFGIFFFVSIPLCAQVLVGSAKIGDSEYRQQRLTLSCPTFDTNKGWKPEKYVITLHILDNPTTYISKNMPDKHGYYSFLSNKWWPFDEINTNKIVIFEKEISRIREYIADGRTKGGTYVKKGDQVYSSFPHQQTCGTLTTFIDRNSLELVAETSDSIPRMEIKSGIMTKCEGMDIWPEEKTQVKSQCQILEYKPPPNRIGF